MVIQNIDGTLIPTADIRNKGLDYFKVAEHSFQVPMLNSSLLFKRFMFWRPFLARVTVHHRSMYSRILARVCAVAMATGLVENKAKKIVFVF